MKKIFIFIFTLVVSLMFSACADRTPFKEKDTISNNSVVYVYMLNDIGDDENLNDKPFSIFVNGKRVTDKIISGEYVAYELKPTKVTISALRGEIESKEIEIDLKPKNSYYLKIKTELDNDDFSFTQMSEQVGKTEILKTGLAGSNRIFKDEKPEEVVSTADANIQKPSKADEIQRLYDMKEKGILTQEEFETLKAKVISK